MEPFEKRSQLPTSGSCNRAGNPPQRVWSEPDTPAGAEYLQLQQSIDIGNTVDRIHAGYLMQTDRFVTADKPFFGAIAAARADVPYPATPLLIQSKTGASALAELQRVL